MTQKSIDGSSPGESQNPQTTSPPAEEASPKASRADSGPRAKRRKSRSRSGSGRQDGSAGTDGAGTFGSDAALADRLETLLEQTPRSIETISETLDGFDAIAVSVAEAAEGTLARVEAACRRAEELNEQLGRTADRISEEGESSQRKIEMLISGLDAGEVLQGRVEKCCDQLKRLVGESEASVVRQSSKLQQLSATAEKRLESFERDVHKVSSERIDVVTGVLEKCASSGRALHRDTVDAEHRVSHLERTLGEITLALGKVEGAASSLKQQVSDANAAGESVRNLNLSMQSTLQHGDSICRGREESLSALIERAEAIVHELRGIDEHVADRAEGLSTSTQAAATIQDQLARTTEAAARSIDDTARIHATLQAAAAEAREHIASLGRRHGAAVEACASAEAVGQKLCKDASALAQFGENRVASQQQRLANLLREAREAAENLGEHQTQADHCNRELVGTLASAQSEHANLTDLTDRTKQDVVEACTQLTREAQALTKDAERSLSTVAASTTANLTDLTDRTKQDVVEACTQLTREAQALTKDAERSLSAVAAETTANLEKIAQQTESRVAPRQEALQRLVEDATTAAATIGDAGHVATRLENMLEKSRTERDILATATGEAAKELESATARVKDIQRESGEITEQSQHVLDQQQSTLTEVAHHAEKLTGQLRCGATYAEEKAAQLTACTHAAVEAEAALCSITTSAYDMHERIQHTQDSLDEGLAHAADARMALETASAEAGDLRQTVTGFNGEVTSLIEQGEVQLTRQHDTIAAAIEEAGCQSDTLCAEITRAQAEGELIGSRQQAATKSAAEAAERVEGLIREVCTLATGTGERARELVQGTQDAKELLDELKPLKPELERLSNDLAEGEEIRQQLSSHLNDQVGQGRDAAQRLQTVKEECAAAMGRLGSQCNAYERMAERVSKSAAELKLDRDAMHANQKTLEQLTQQNEALETTVQQAQIATDALRAEINGLLAEPQTVVCEAKQKALQLTTVCRAVKKVFANLSQTSLGASEKIEQLSQLTTTLQQWIGEAVHVQKRLETTVHQAPSIGQTHPPAKLY
ncbi:MAG: hypothetical protein GY842_16870, partial [bacterium]|nr:hypothetical protein [bacterium]